MHTLLITLQLGKMLPGIFGSEGENRSKIFYEVSCNHINHRLSGPSFKGVGSVDVKPLFNHVHVKCRKVHVNKLQRQMVNPVKEKVVVSISKFIAKLGKLGEYPSVHLHQPVVL